jgi:hypothetical protein
MIAGGSASEAEAAAIAAALEQFLADTAPAPQARESVSRWQRAALQEGVGAKQAFGAGGWGRSAPLP